MRFEASCLKQKPPQANTRLGITGSIEIFGGSFTGTAGIAIDGTGNIGTYSSYGVGVSIGGGDGLGGSGNGAGGSSGGAGSGGFSLGGSNYPF